MTNPPDSKTDDARQAAQRLVNKGLQVARNGAWANAEVCFRDAAKLLPDFAEAHHNRSIALQNLGRLKPAMDLAEKAVSLDPKATSFQINLGNVAARLGKTEQAKKAFLHCIAMDPQDKASRLNLAVTLFSEQRWHDAAHHLEMLHNPNEINLHVDYLLALTKLSLDEIDVAQSLLESLVAKKPENIKFVVELANANARQFDWPATLEYANQALAIEPNNTVALLLKAESIAQFQGGREEVATLVQTLVELHPDSAEIRARVGYLHLLLGDYSEAESALTSVLDTNPKNPFALATLGRLHLELHDYDQATQKLEHAIALNNRDRNAIYNLSVTYLALGRLAEGWDLSDDPNCGGRASALGRIKPAQDWTDKSLAGQRLRIRPEQGLGDELLFSTCYADAIREAGTCIIECDPRLASIFQRTYPTARFEPVDVPTRLGGNPPSYDFDLECMAGSLPRRYRRSIDAFPVNEQLLQPDSNLCQKWIDRLGALGDTFKIGLCWRSGVVDRYRVRNSYYTHLDDWGPLFALPNVSIVNLFYGECAHEIVTAKQQFDVEVHVWDDTDLKNDLEDVFALIDSLDLVITTQSAVWNMAGAVGKDSLVLLNPNSQLGTDTMPWHRSIEPVTHVHAKPWSDVVDHIVDRVRTRMER